MQSERLRARWARVWQGVLLACCSSPSFPNNSCSFLLGCDNYMPYGRSFSNSSCNMPCQADGLELCGAGNRLALYQDSDATPLDPAACIPGRQGSFQNFQLQAVAKQGPLNTVQIYPATLNPNTDNAPQYTILSVCTSSVLHMFVTDTIPNQM